MHILQSLRSRPTSPWHAEWTGSVFKKQKPTNVMYWKVLKLSFNCLFHVELTCAWWRPATALVSVYRVHEQSSLATHSPSDNSLASLSSSCPPRWFLLLWGLSESLSPPLDRSWHQLGRSWTHPVCRTSHQPPTVPERLLRWRVGPGDCWAPLQRVSADKETWQHEPRVLVAAFVGATPGVLHLLRTAGLYRTERQTEGSIPVLVLEQCCIDEKWVPWADLEAGEAPWSWSAPSRPGARPWADRRIPL